MAQESNKVGSSSDEAAKVVGERDFGVHEDDVRERNYVSEETKRNDPGKGIAHSGTGPRTSGVGGNDSGRGSSSGGDMDAGDDALIGIGDKNLHPPHQQPHQPGQGKPRQTLNPPVMPDDPTRAGTLDNESSTSAADVNNEVHQGNSFKGDVTADEATGGA